MFLTPEFFWQGPLKICTSIIKPGLVLTIVQNFMPLGPRISEILRWKKKNKLEIWGKA